MKTLCNTKQQKLNNENDRETIYNAKQQQKNAKKRCNANQT